MRVEGFSLSLPLITAPQLEVTAIFPKE